MFEEAVEQGQAVRATTPADERLDTLRGHVERLANVVGKLDDRLHPVLAEASEGRDTNARALRPSGSSPFVARLDTLADLIDLEIERLGNILARIEV